MSEAWVSIVGAGMDRKLSEEAFKKFMAGLSERISNRKSFPLHAQEDILTILGLAGLANARASF